MFRKTYLLISCLVLSALLLSIPGTAGAFVPGGSLDPTTIPKFTEALFVPPAMPKTGTVGDADYYEIAAREFDQQILPGTLPKTTVWGYGSINHPVTFSSPASTIEAVVDRPVRVKWINDLRDAVTGNFLPHMFPVDQTLHWANPPMDCIDGAPRTDCRGKSQSPYTGPVPIITHLHGSHVGPESDGFPQAWYLPAANNIPAGFATKGSHFGQIAGEAEEAGAAVFRYPNDQRPTTLWYHDHSLGLTRLHVYAGLAGMYILRDSPTKRLNKLLPGPAPAEGDEEGKSYFEMPLVIQDKSFNADGSLFYPDNRAFFEGLQKSQLQIPFTPDSGSDVAPVWNPEFFGNTMVVNGKTWPYLNVEQKRYRFRILNASNSRFLILKLESGVDFWQIGADGGFLPAAVKRNKLLIAPAERADVIVDFSKLSEGKSIKLLNLGPDEPFGGGEPEEDFEPSDPDTTGQVMEFRVVERIERDKSGNPKNLPLPAAPRLGAAKKVRKLSLNEEESKTVLVSTDQDGNIVADPAGAPFGPTMAKLGILDADRNPVGMMFDEEVTETPTLNTVETWEIYNFTADAHPIHLHLVQFQVVNRQDLRTDEEGISEPPARLKGKPIPPKAWEKGPKDTVIAYPGTVTRVKAKFDIEGLFIWHCHILEHEDNDMMRPFEVKAAP